MVFDQLSIFFNNRSKLHDSDVFGTYREIIDFEYRLLISFLRVIRPSDYDLKYNFGPIMLEYDQKKLYVSRFLQLVFVMTSPLSSFKNYTLLRTAFFKVNT